MIICRLKRRAKSAELRQGTRRKLFFFALLGADLSPRPPGSHEA